MTAKSKDEAAMEELPQWMVTPWYKHSLTVPIAFFCVLALLVAGVLFYYQPKVMDATSGKHATFLKGTLYQAQGCAMLTDTASGKTYVLNKRPIDTTYGDTIEVTGELAKDTSPSGTLDICGTGDRFVVSNYQDLTTISEHPTTPVSPAQTTTIPTTTIPVTGNGSANPATK